MLTFVLWREKNDRGRRQSADRVGEKLRHSFRSVFEGPPAAVVRSRGNTHLAFLELPIRGWRQPYFSSDGERWALAADQPLNARAVLASNGIQSSVSDTLLTLGSNLARNPEPLLRDLTPPFSLIYSEPPDPEQSGSRGASQAEGVTWVNNDGLGQAQLFEYEDDRIWAVTNRIFALRSLGIELEPDEDAWAARFAIEWFPLDLTGYRRVRLLPPGTQVRLDADGVHHSSHDVLAGWVHPDRLDKRECLDLGLESIRSIFSETMQSWDCPTVGLSGGWDSRALVSILRNLDADFSLRVRGNPGRYDVMISAELARIADLKLRFKNEGGYPPEDPHGLESSLTRALVWQGGHMSINKHKTFLNGGGYLDGGVVNVMGQHGGFGKADFAVKTRAHELRPNQYEKKLVEVITKKMPVFTRPEKQERIRELAVESYRTADRYKLKGLARLHFFFMHEYTRRWASATLSSQPGLVIAPFLSPNFIRACYAYPLEEIPTKPFHRHITRAMAPDWADVIYEDQASEEDVASGRLQPVRLKRRKRKVHAEDSWKRSRAHKKYSASRYWSTVGEKLMADALARGGFWTELFDPDQVRQSWAEAPGKTSPDPLAIAHVLPKALKA